MIKIGSLDRIVLPLLLVGLFGLLGFLVYGRMDFRKDERLPAAPGAAQTYDSQGDSPQLVRLYQEAKAAHGKFVNAFGYWTGKRNASLAIHPGATTAAEAAALFHRYYLRDLDLYLAHTKDQGAARDAGAAFIKAAVPANFGTFSADTNLDELSRQAGELWRSDSTDPVLRSHTARWLDLEGDWPDVGNQFSQKLLAVIANLRDTPYPASVEVSLRSVLYSRVGGMEGVNQKERQALMNQAIVKWLKEESPQPEWHRCVFSRLSDILPLEERKSILTLGGEQGVAPWILHTLAGQYYLKNALDWRGASYVSEVKSENWKVFERDSERAAVHLRYAWSLHPELPVTSAMMITISNSSSDDGRTPTDWFHKLLEAQFDYEMGYENYMLSLLPRWGGSERQMIAFARNCLATNRFDTDVPEYALQTVTNLADYERHPLKTLFKDIPATREIIDAYCQQRAQWLKDNAGKKKLFQSQSYPARVVRFYLENGFPEEAYQTALTGTDEVPYQHRWDLPRYGDYGWQKLRAGSASLRPLINRLDQGLHVDRSQVLSAETVDKLSADLQQFEKLATTVPAKNLLRHFQVMFDQRQAFSNGDWVELLNGPDRAGCEFYASDSRYLEDGKLWELHGTPQFKEDMQVVVLAGLAPPFEIELQASAVPTVGRFFGGVSAGIGWSPPRNRSREEAKDPKKSPRYTYFGLTPQALAKNGQKVSACFPTSNGGVDFGDVGWKGPTERLRLNLWSDAYEYRAGQFAMTGPLSQPLRADGSLTIGERAGDGSDSNHDITMLVGAMRVRRAKTPSVPATSTNVAEQIAYWEQRHQADSDDVVPKRALARLLAKTDAQRALKLGRELLAVTPSMNGIHCSVGLALTELKQFEEAAAELKIAQYESPTDTESSFGLIENWLARPEPTKEMYGNAERLAIQLSQVDKCRSLMAQARISFLQKDSQRAVNLIKLAMDSASEEEKKELQKRLEEFQSSITPTAP